MMQVGAGGLLNPALNADYHLNDMDEDLNTEDGFSLHNIYR